MIPNERPKAISLIQAIAATFNRECDEAMLFGYWLAIRDLSLESLERASERAIKELDRMPTGKDLRKLAGVLGPSQRSLVGWNAVTLAMAHHGPYRHVDFDDPIINATIRTMGGWPEFYYRFGRDKEEWIRKEFEKVYCGLFEGGVNGDIIAPLAGLSEATYRNGQLLAPPVEQVETGLPMPKLNLLPSPSHNRPNLKLERLDEGDAA